MDGLVVGEASVCGRGACGGVIQLEGGVVVSGAVWEGDEASIGAVVVGAFGVVEGGWLDWVRASD